MQRGRCLQRHCSAAARSLSATGCCRCLKIQTFEFATRWTIITAMFSTDWTLTGALCGVAVLAGVVSYGSFALMKSRPNLTREYPASAVLIPAHNRPAATLTAPSVADAPGLQAERIEIFDPAEPTQNPSQIETAVPGKGIDPAFWEGMENRPGDYPRSGHNGSKSPPDNTAKANHNFPIVLGVGY
jgi:hypothetical protein